MAFDLMVDSIQAGYLLLPDETALCHPGFLSFLRGNKDRLPPHSIVFLRTFASSPAANKVIGVFAGIPKERNPLLLIDFTKPILSALSERGDKYAFAVLTTDEGKGKVYAGTHTGKRHQTVLISGTFDCELLKPTTPSQTSSPVAPDASSPVPTVVFKYFGDSKQTPPPLGNALDTGFEEDETGRQFIGSSGRVFTATKLCNPGGATGRIYLTDDPGLVVKRFVKEQLYPIEQEKLRLMCAKPLTHPNIIWPMEIISKKGPNGHITKDIGYVMRCCPFPDLDGIVNRKRFLPRFPTKDVLIEAIIQICDAFDYMLRANVVNGDIKLANIVFDDAKRIPYVVDLDPVQIDKYINRMATPGYIPPEVYKGSENCQGKWEFYRKKYSDYFAISVVIFIMLVGVAFPYSSPDGALDDNTRKALTYQGNFSFASPKESTLKNENHIAAVVRWMHLPSFVRQAFIDTFDHKGAHYMPNVRYSPADWKRIMTAYLKMLRDPNSKLAKKDPDYYLETAPLLKKDGSKQPAEIPLKTLEIDMVKEVVGTRSALSLDKAVTELVRHMKLKNVNADSVINELRIRGIAKIGSDTTFTLQANLPFLKRVECKTFETA